MYGTNKFYMFLKNSLFFLIDFSYNLIIKFYGFERKVYLNRQVGTEKFLPWVL